MCANRTFVRLEKTVPEMVTGCLRMIKSIIFILYKTLKNVHTKLRIICHSEESGWDSPTFTVAVYSTSFYTKIASQILIVLTLVNLA